MESEWEVLSRKIKEGERNAKSKRQAKRKNKPDGKRDVRRSK